MNQTIKKGDIVIFKAENSWLSKAVAWLTDSDVSHAAMVYDEEQIIETLAPGVCINSVEYESGDEVYILRLKKRLDPAPLIAAAKEYYDHNTRYDFPSLVLLGGLLIYKKINLNHRLLKITNLILQQACLVLDDYIQKMLGHTDRPMVCSQFVYQVYLDCGKEYRIILENDRLLYSRADQSSEGMIRLIDYIDSDRIEPDLCYDKLPWDTNTNQIDCANDEMIQELYLALSEEETRSDIDIALYLNSSPTLRLAEALLAKAKRLLDVMQSNLPLDAMFVTPADFIYHSTNLDQVCITKLRRRGLI